MDQIILYREIVQTLLSEIDSYKNHLPESKHSYFLIGRVTTIKS